MGTVFFLGNAVRGAVGSAVSQGIGVATGLQSKFNWADVAVSGVVAGIGGAVGRGIGGSVGSSYFNKLGEEMVRATPSFTSSLLSGMADGIAGAAARSLADGTSFGDNLIATLPVVLGSTIAIVDGVSKTTARLPQYRCHHPFLRPRCRSLLYWRRG